METRFPARAAARLPAPPPPSEASEQRCPAESPGLLALPGKKRHARVILPESQLPFLLLPDLPVEGMILRAPVPDPPAQLVQPVSGT